MRRYMHFALALICIVVIARPTPARAVGAQPLKVVLLGDSYSAGNGARDTNGASHFFGPEGCFRSRDGWAQQYVDHLSATGFNVTFVNGACSGAVMADITGRPDTPDGGRLVKSYGRTAVLDDPPETWTEEAILAVLREEYPCPSPATHIGQTTDVVPVINTDCAPAPEEKVEARGRTTLVVLAKGRLLGWPPRRSTPGE